MSLFPVAERQLVARNGAHSEKCLQCRTSKVYDAHRIERHSVVLSVMENRSHSGDKQLRMNELIVRFSYYGIACCFYAGYLYGRKRNTFPTNICATGWC